MKIAILAALTTVAFIGEAAAGEMKGTVKSVDMDKHMITLTDGMSVKTNKDVKLDHVMKGDHVKITITSNASDEAHLHGIDKEVELEPGKPATIEFDADEQGAYELELHHAGTTIGTVEVR